MNIIATNKILEYIEKHPEARIPLLMWLKEYPYGLGRKTFPDQDGNPQKGIASAGFEAGGYSISCIVNYDTETYMIEWLANEEELKAKLDRRYKEELEKDINVVTMTVSETVVVVTPPPITQTPELEMVSFTFNSIEGGTHTVTSMKWDPLDTSIEPALPEGQGFRTRDEYERALSRAEAIFKSVPGTPEFDEMLALLPLIRDFENYKLKFPVLHNFEILKNRLDLFNMKATYLPAAAGSEEEVKLFLAGQLELPDEIVNQMFRILYFRIPIEDKRFSM